MLSAEQEIHPLFFDNVGIPDESDQKDSLSIRLSKERLERKDQITELAKRIKEINGIHELQVDLYSVRQDLLERYHYLFTLVLKQNAVIRKKSKSKFEYYSNEYQFSTSTKQKEDLVKSDLEKEYSVKDELENQIKYISGTMTTVDNIIYGIKHRIDIEEHRRRM